MRFRHSYHFLAAIILFLSLTLPHALPQSRSRPQSPQRQQPAPFQNRQSAPIRSTPPIVPQVRRSTIPAPIFRNEKAPNPLNWKNPFTSSNRYKVTVSNGNLRFPNVQAERLRAALQRIPKPSETASGRFKLLSSTAISPIPKNLKFAARPKSTSLVPVARIGQKNSSIIRSKLVALKNAENSAKVARSGRSGETPTPRVLLETGKQGKHIIGHNNYIPGKSIFTHPNPQDLLDNFAGKGRQTSPVAKGLPGFKERVDFGQVIGEVDGQPTTQGMIHYSKEGAHIVPATPD